jgi:hypothetical protein
METPASPERIALASHLRAHRHLPLRYARALRRVRRCAARRGGRRRRPRADAKRSFPPGSAAPGPPLRFQTVYAESVVDLVSTSRTMLGRCRRSRHSAERDQRAGALPLVWPGSSNAALYLLFGLVCPRMTPPWRPRLSSRGGSAVGQGHLRDLPDRHLRGLRELRRSHGTHRLWLMAK